VDDYIEIGNSLLATNLDELTINFSIKIENYNINQSQAIISKWSDENQSTARAFHIHWVPEGYINFIINGGCSVVSMNIYNLIINDWNLLTFVYNNNYNYLKIYHNGIMISENPSDCNAPTHTYSNTLKIARHSEPGWPNHEYFDGIIDNISIWSRELSESEINNLDNTIINSDTGLLSYWKFNAGDGDILYDHSGNGNHGTIYGAQWVCNEEIDLCGVWCGDNSTCTIISDIDGNEYGTVEIGEQLWMRQNLKVAHYNDGDAIPTGLDNDAWSSTTEGSYAVYGDDPLNAEVYGNLYNWYAVDDDRGVCPENYHVPSDEEFKQLEIYLGMDEATADLEGWRGTNQGSMLAGTEELWLDGTLKLNNAFGSIEFNAIPASSRGLDGIYHNAVGEYTYFWSSDENTNDRAWYRVIYNSYSNINRYSLNKRLGHSIRCLETIEGCTDSLAINNTYDPLANTNDGSCEYPDAGDYSLSFDGEDDYVTIPKSETLNLEDASEFTIQVYINNDALPDSPTWRILISNTGTLSNSSFPTYGGYLLRYGGDSSPGPYKYMFAFQTTSTNSVNTSEVMAYETWQELSIVYNGATLEYYYDGVLVGSHEVIGNFNDYDGDITLGKGATIWGTKYFPGNLDDLRIWDKALTQEEIQSYMTIPPAGSETGLIGYWKFNSDSGNTLYDHSGNGNHGTIYGATWAGCTDENSCDYLPYAVIDDGSCVIYPDCAGVCYGDSYEDECGTCDDDSSNDCFDYCLDLHEGANLISFYALPDDVSITHVMASIEGNATGVIGQGVAANYNGTDWVGSLNTISSLSGYWMIVSEAGSLCIEDGISTAPTTQYSLNSGANLISFPIEGSVEVSSSLPDDIEGFVSGIIGEGVAANNQPPWQGSLSNLSGGNGYWMITTENISFSFDVSTMSRVKFDNEVGLTAPDNKEIHQSTQQAFYFIESIENIEVNDWILAYNGDNVIGARQWQGSIIDVPAMGTAQTILRVI